MDGTSEGMTTRLDGNGEGRFMPVSFSARVEVTRPMRPLRATAYIVAAVLFTLSGLALLLRFNVYGLLCLAVAAAAAAGYRHSSRTRVLTFVPSYVSAQDGVLTVALAGARLYDDIYVDQRYIMHGSAIEAAWVGGAGDVHIRARMLTSEAWRGSELLESTQLELSEFTFTPDASGLAAMHGALAALGIELG